MSKVTRHPGDHIFPGAIIEVTEGDDEWSADIILPPDLRITTHKYEGRIFDATGEPPPNPGWLTQHYAKLLPPDDHPHADASSQPEAAS